MEKRIQRYFNYLIKWIFLFVGFLFLNISAISQDPVFSQFNNSPLLINPAFAGNSYAPVFHVNSRVQWPSIQFAYNTFSFSYDQFFKKYNSAVGINILNDIAGGGVYSTIKLEAIYGYKLRIKENNYIKMGLSLALIQNRLDWDKLVFYDQLDAEFGYELPNGQIIQSGEVRPEKLSIINPDLSMGLLYYSQKVFFGLSVKHINSPDQQFFLDGKQAATGLSPRYSFQLGAQFLFGNTNSGKQTFISPSVLFVRQANINQLNINAYIDLGTIYAGLGVRHDFSNADALIVGLGIQTGIYKIGYSYDMTISDLSINTGGAHELGVMINFDNSEWFEKPLRYSDCFEIFR